MERQAALARHQRRRLEQIRALGMSSDDSMSAHLASIGVECDRSTLVKYRSGDRTAPLGLLDVILGHVDDPACVLDLWARDHGLEVVRGEPELTENRDIPDRTLELAERMSDLMKSVRLGRAEGFAPEDIERFRESAALLARCLGKLTAAIEQHGSKE